MYTALSLPQAPYLFSPESGNLNDIPCLSNKGAVLIHGRRAPILGRVCMDQFMVDVTDIPDVKNEDEVILIGRDGDECITMEEVGGLSGRFNYEFACDLGKRIPRVYIHGGRIIGTRDHFSE